MSKEIIILRCNTAYKLISIVRSELKSIFNDMSNERANNSPAVSISDSLLRDAQKLEDTIYEFRNKLSKGVL
ncbi:MAG: hypothetical protein LBC87_07305 [Fibromonadaceae bacterium]|nr:hypothetical protein [Fibromonadaceae bacterium]